jgi:hypothetical protein
MDDTPSQVSGPDMPKRAVPVWAKLVAALIAAGALIAVASFFGSRSYYQVRPLSLDGQSQDKHVDPTPFGQALASAVVSPEQQRCQYITVLDLSRPAGSADDGVTRAGQAVCEQFLKDGSSLIAHPVEAGGSTYYDGRTGSGIIRYDGQDYLVSFVLTSPDPASGYKIFLTTVARTKTDHVDDLELISIPNLKQERKVLHIVGTTASGAKSEEYFAMYFGRYAEGNFNIPLVKENDGTFSVVVSQRATELTSSVSFLAPYDGFGAGGGYAERDYTMERDIKKAPLYHRESCGLEDAYGDVGFSVHFNSTSISINLGLSDTLYLTTPVYGYVPEEWGTVLSSISMASVRKRVAEAKAYNSSAPAEMLTIAGFTVKHVGPVTPERGCQYASGLTYDIYQAVKEGAVVTFTMRSDADNPRPSDADVQKLIGKVLSTLTVSR